MIFNVLTIFPEMFPGPLGFSKLGKALRNGLWELNVVNIRSFALDKHASVDDRPFGGGAGMLLRADVIGRCVDFVLANNPKTKLIFTSPRGVRFNQDIARQTVDFGNITLLCGRFEGVDDRVIDFYRFDEVSIGDYVLSGGELAAMAMIDACVRLIPGVLGNSASLSSESMTGGLEYPQYTRPAIWRDLSVPDVLLRGDHSKIASWKEKMSRSVTEIRRPDLLCEKCNNDGVG